MHARQGLTAWSLKLLPHPRFLERQSGTFLLPARATLQLDRSLPTEIASAITARLQSTAKDVGVKLKFRGSRRKAGSQADITASKNSARQTHAQSYVLNIGRDGIRIEFHDPGGLWAAVATLRQLIREHGRRLPCLKIRDWPDFPRRGVMLDISRGRVPRLETLLELVEQLADFKINEFQLYTEHTFAYRKYVPVWRDWGALTGAEIERLDAHIAG